MGWRDEIGLEARKIDPFEADVDAAIRDLDRLWAESGTTMDDIPLETRHKALQLELQMTRAANAGDMAGARAALKEWQQCWIVK